MYIYKMSWIKKIVAGLFVIVNLAIAFDYSPISEPTTRISCTELLASKNDVLNKVIRFDTALQSLLFSNCTTNYSNFDWYNGIQKADSKNLVDFKSQNCTSLEFKVLLLNIVLNDIIQQKSHWI